MASLGRILDQSFQEEASLVREAQQTRDPGRLQQIQSSLAQLQQQRHIAQQQSGDVDQLQGQIAGIGGTGGQVSRGPNDFDPAVAKMQQSSRGSLSQVAPGQSAGASRQVPMVDPIANTAIQNSFLFDRFSGVDFKNPAHVKAVRKRVERALTESSKSGQLTDMAQLQDDILGDITKNTMDSLRTEKEFAGLKAEIAQSKAKIKKATRELSGTRGLSKATIGKLEDNAIGSVKLNRKLNAVADRFSPKFFNRFGQGKIRALKEAQKVGTPLTGLQRQDIREFTAFEKNVKQIFNEYRKHVTGAQASEKEIKILEDSFLSMSFSPDEFKAALSGLIAMNELNIVTSEHLLEAGIDSPQLEELAKTDKRIAKLMSQWDGAIELARGKASENKQELTDEDRASLEEILKSRGL